MKNAVTFGEFAASWVVSRVAVRGDSQATQAYSL